jgi:hypothetical protein
LLASESLSDHAFPRRAAGAADRDKPAEKEREYDGGGEDIAKAQKDSRSQFSKPATASFSETVLAEFRDVRRRLAEELGVDESVALEAALGMPMRGEADG